MEELNQMFFSVSTHWALVAHPIPLTPVLQGQSMSSQSSVRVSYGIEEVQAWVAMFGCNSLAAYCICLWR